MTYEEALKQYKKASAENTRAERKLAAAERDLEAAKKELDIECSSCHKTTKVKNIELIVKKYGGYYSSYDEEHHYNTWTVWVCPHCTAAQWPPSEKEGPFAKEKPYSHSFDHYVKDIHEWYSDSERCHGRVLQLLGPHIKRQEEAYQKQEKERKIEAAKKLLAEEGIMVHNE